MSIRAVVFDVGETLVDEIRIWSRWADWLSVPYLTFFAILGSVIERDEHHHRVFGLVRPDIDLDQARAAMIAAGAGDDFGPDDLYPDVRACLDSLRADGYRLGIAGNQSVESEAWLQALGLPVDLIASSAGWGVRKPAPAFFSRVAQEIGALPAEVAYVGDRLDTDALAAAAAGMVGIFLRRGPWGHIHARRVAAGQAHLRIDSLAELPAALRERR